jgi:hypothetical protein
MTTSPADTAKGHQRRRQAHDRGRITLMLAVILALVAANAAAGRVPPLVQELHRVEQEVSSR